MSCREEGKRGKKDIFRVAEANSRQEKRKF
jgi:hypothetical protein